MILLPMAEPEFFDDGRIRYACPTGCGWHFWMKTYPMFDLDEHVRRTRELMSNHYRNTHGVNEE